MCSCAEETEGEVYDDNESHKKTANKTHHNPSPTSLPTRSCMHPVRSNTTTLSSTSSLHLLTTSKARRSTCDPHSGSAQELTANAGGPWTDLLGGWWCERPASQAASASEVHERLQVRLLAATAEIHERLEVGRLAAAAEIHERFQVRVFRWCRRGARSVSQHSAMDGVGGAGLTRDGRGMGGDDERQGGKQDAADAHGWSYVCYKERAWMRWAGRQGFASRGDFLMARRSYMTPLLLPHLLPPSVPLGCSRWAVGRPPGGRASKLQFPSPPFEF